MTATLKHGMCLELILGAFSLAVALSACAAPVEPVRFLAAKEKAPLIDTLEGLVSI
jgi:hypothetical protein